jgi:hypothetical protein
MKLPKKIKYKTHKDHGNHSFIVDESCAGQTFFGRKRNLGDKVVHPDDYGKRNNNYDNRTRAELRNADDIMLSKQYHLDS